VKLRFSFILGLALLAACSAPPPSVPGSESSTQIPSASPSPPPVTAAPAGSWLDWPIAPGDWVYRQDDRGSIALFGDAGGDALVTLRCDVLRDRVYLTRKSAQAASNFTLRSSARLKSLAAVTTGGSLPYIAAEILPDDPILDALAYSRGRIALETDGELPVALPVWSEIGRIVEDCRK
jgi:hypothetical protein